MALFGQQGFERIEEFFLRSVLVGKKLHIVDQQQIERVVALLELVKSAALVGLNHIRHKLLGVDVENFGIWAVGQQLVAHGMHQVGFAQAHTAIDEKRVVQVPGHARHVHGRRARHAVGRALHQGLERQRRIEPGAKGAGRGFVAAVVLCVRRGGGLGGCGPDVSARNGFTLSKR